MKLYICDRSYYGCIVRANNIEDAMALVQKWLRGPTVGHYSNMDDDPVNADELRELLTDGEPGLVEDWAE